MMSLFADEQVAVEPQSTPGFKRVVICVDGIVTALLRKLTPDISWEAYVSWLRHRRPDLEVIWLSQPHDWFEILTRRAASYESLVEQMTIEALAHLDRSWKQVAILGFSMGGLTALRVATQVARLEQQLDLDYFAYVTFGTPFAGTGGRRERVFSRMPIDYLGEVYNKDSTQRLLKELCLFAHQGCLRMLFGEVVRDEIVHRESALAPLDWLTQWQPTGDFQASGFTIRNRGALIRHHDGLLYDSHAIGYIDGLVDGLFPPAAAPQAYAPFQWREWRAQMLQRGG